MSIQRCLILTKQFLIQIEYLRWQIDSDGWKILSNLDSNRLTYLVLIKLDFVIVWYCRPIFTVNDWHPTIFPFTLNVKTNSHNCKTDTIESIAYLSILRSVWFVPSDESTMQCHMNTFFWVLDIYHCIRSSLTRAYCLFAGKQTSVYVCSTCVHFTVIVKIFRVSMVFFSSLLFFSIFYFNVFIFLSLSILFVPLKFRYFNWHVFARWYDLRR